MTKHTSRTSDSSRLDSSRVDPSKGDPLKAYRDKRDFSITSEPSGVEKTVKPKNAAPLAFVIQKHWATRLHYDLRLELEGTMKSWAVPKGPSFDPNDKRMAIHVEDHPISYNTFEGEIPAGQYGAGKVIVWDKGIWVPLENPHTGYREGKLKFELHGYKLKGHWTLVRMRNDREQKQDAWLLIKEKDIYARPSSEYSVVDEMPDSVSRLKALTLGESAELQGKDVNHTVDEETRVTKNKAALPSDAVKRKLPKSLEPELATLVDAPPGDPEEWVFEIKFDGYRLLARIDESGIRVFTRNGHDWTDKLPDLVESLQELELKPCWLDGEIVVMDENNLPDFQALQNAFDNERTQNISYFLFDLPFYDGNDLRNCTLLERKELLKAVLDKNNQENIQVSEFFDAPPGEVLNSACRIGLEGIIGKRKNSTYVSRRTTEWVKLKCRRRQEFVIGGYTDPKGTRNGIGSLLLGYYDENGAFQYAGNVGSGFSEKTLRELREKFDHLATAKCPFVNERGIEKKAHWVKPVLVAEVSFSEWTRGNHVRQAVFRGLRTDKEPDSIGRERATHLDPPKTASRTSIPEALKITNPDRVVDPSTGFRKIDLIRYYALVAPLMMEHLKGRPVSLVRAPEGIGGQLFFQKHWEKENMEGINQLDPALDPDHESLTEISNAEGLLAAAQMNVVEFHTWNAKKDLIGKPDRMTFDLDPGEGVEWPTVQESAELVSIFLKQLGLKSFLKTTGGKGLHVVVPIRRTHDWDTVKDFSQAIVQHLANTIPGRFVAKSGPRNRVAKIFIDYLRNGFGATTVSAWSVRARPGLGVSVPITWEELGSVSSSSRWTAVNIHQRLDKGNEPWADYDHVKQSITPAMKTLGFEAGKKA
jgi:bifunctional non-homologous end joining protein LigD